jgi:phosphomevalonate kinase
VSTDRAKGGSAPADGGLSARAVDDALGVSAPGKLMISGEYAVLDGAEAIVASVDRRAVVRRVSAHDASSLPPEAQASFELAQRQLGHVPGGLALDVTALRSGDKKLGLGSSAAAAVAAAGCVFAFHGHDLGTLATRKRIMDVALEGHRAVAPGGSGADVAASALGGFVRFVRHGDRIEADPAPWPAALPVRVVWTGQEARTSTFVAKVKALQTADPARYAAVMDVLKQAAALVVRALESTDPTPLIAAIDGYGLAMDALGAAAGVSIVTDTLRGIADAARAVGGAAKPSGAGGGDVAIAILPDLRAVTHFDAACRTLGAELLSLSLGTVGVEVDASRR